MEKVENVYENVPGVKKNKIINITRAAVAEILTKLYNELASGESLARIQEAKTEVKNDPIEVLRVVFPIVVEVKIRVFDELELPQFEKGEEGLTEFMKVANYFSHRDEQVREIFMKIRDFYLPRIPLPQTPTSFEFVEQSTSKGEKS